MKSRDNRKGVLPKPSTSVCSTRAPICSLSRSPNGSSPNAKAAVLVVSVGADFLDNWGASVPQQLDFADARAKFPRFFHMEYGADSHLGRHTYTPIDTLGPRASRGYEEVVGQPVENIARDGDWSESYQTDLMDWHLMVSERQDSLTGNAQWVFKDFATPLRPENPIPYVNQKGLLTRDGTPKDAYYVYKSYWTTSPKFAYIVSHDLKEPLRGIHNFSRMLREDHGPALGDEGRDEGRDDVRRNVEARAAIPLGNLLADP